MNYYRKQKLADQDMKFMPLPAAHTLPEEEEIDQDRQGGIREIDELDEFESGDQNKAHPNLEYLGAGNWGVAYLSGSDSGVVIKYTAHQNEYNNALKILELQKEKKSSIPGVVTVYHAEHVSTRKGIYKIWLEKVFPISEHEFKLFNRLSSLVCRWNDELDENNNDEEILINRDVVITKENLDILKKVRRLREKIQDNEIRGDMHAGNIGKDSNGEYVILDIGGLF